MDLLKKFLYLTLITFPLGVILRINIFKSTYIYPLDVAVFAVFLTILFISIKIKKNIFSFPNIKALYYFIGIAFFALVLNSYFLTPQTFLVSFFYLFRFIIYSSLILAFNYLDAGFSKKFIYYLSLSGFLFVVFGLAQYLFYPDLRKLYYLGWDKHLYRLFSTTLDPNFAGAIIVLELLLLFSLFQKKIIRKNLSKIIYMVGLLLTSVSLFLTYSRSSFIMLSVSGLSYLVVTKQKREIVLLIAFIVFGILFLPKSLKSEGVDLLRRASISSRAESIASALDIFKNSPVFGIGFNTYRYAQERRGMLDPDNWEITHSGAGVPNSFILALVTTGLTGFIFYLNFWVRVVRKAYLGIIPGKNLYFKAAVFSSLIGVLTHALFENTLFYSFVMFWVFILLSFKDYK